MSSVPEPEEIDEFDSNPVGPDSGMPAPRGPLSCSEHLMGQALLLSDEFKIFAKDGPNTPAVDRIKFEIIERPDPELDYFSVQNLEDVRPFVCIYPSDFSMARVASQGILFNGSLQLLFEASYNDIDPKLRNESEILRFWKNRVGVILKEAFSRSHDNIFNIARIDNLVWWTRSLIKPEDQHLGFSCVVSWGPDLP